MTQRSEFEDPMVRLKTERLVLEPLVRAHAREMWPLLRDPELYHHLLAPPPASREKLEEKYHKLESRRSADGSQIWLNWIVRKKDGPAIGFVQGTLIETEAWIGYVFGQAHWGRGYALESNRCMLEHLAEVYGIHRFLASADRGNEASLRLLDRLGFHLATPEEATQHEFPETDYLYVRYERRQ